MMKEEAIRKQEALRLAAERLHHLSMRYTGAFVELLKGEKIFGLSFGHPGLRETRDLIDLVLLTRAEINGLTKILVDAGIVTEARFTEIMTEQYDWFAKTKADFLGVGVSDAGLIYRSDQD